MTLRNLAKTINIPCIGIVFIERGYKISVPFFYEKDRGEYLLYWRTVRVIFTPKGWKPPSRTTQVKPKENQNVTQQRIALEDAPVQAPRLPN